MRENSHDFDNPLQIIGRWSHIDSVSYCDTIEGIHFESESFGNYFWTFLNIRIFTVYENNWV